VLLGEDGDDWLGGDLGNDSLTGGAGLDRFIVGADGSLDRVLDFTDGQDGLMLAGGLTFAQLTVTPIPNATTISVSQTGKVLVQLDGVNASAIGIEDFG
jgi:Ca2+-binding RTX toxin-like protein